MTLPIRSAYQTDAIVLEQAMKKLEETRLAFKKFAKAPSVVEDVTLHEAIDALRARLKKLRKRARRLEVQWTEKARSSE